MVTKRLGAVTVALTLLAAGCSSSDDEASRYSSASLQEAEAAWANAGIDNYRISATETLNYWSQGCTWHKVIAAGLVSESAIDQNSTGSFCGERPMRVEDLHRQIAQMASEIRRYGDFGEDNLDVTFNDLGVPESIEFDLVNGADEEVSLRVTFTAFTAVEMELSAESDPAADLAAARRAWANAGIDNYRISTAEGRNVWSSGCTWTTVVIDGVAAESVTDPTSAPPVCYEPVYTVEVLHDRIEEMADRVGRDHDHRQNTLEVSFNDVGVPESIEYDLKSGVDEESLMQITFTTLP